MMLFDTALQWLKYKVDIIQKAIYCTILDCALYNTVAKYFSLIFSFLSWKKLCGKVFL